MDPRELESFEQRARTRFLDSVEDLDMPTRSRLTQARHAALQAAPARRPSRLPGKAWWMPAAGFSAAALLGAALWMGTPLGHPSGTAFGHHAVSLGDAQSNLEDLDIVAASDDPLDMLQDDPDFYDFAEKAANSEPAA